MTAIQEVAKLFPFIPGAGFKAWCGNPDVWQFIDPASKTNLMLVRINADEWRLTDGRSTVDKKLWEGRFTEAGAELTSLLIQYGRNCR